MNKAAILPEIFQFCENLIVEGPHAEQVCNQVSGLPAGLLSPSPVVPKSECTAAVANDPD